MRRLIIVSNRLPYTLTRTPEGWSSAPSTGGLATAIEPLFTSTGGVWIGWSGDSSGALSDESRLRVLNEWAERRGFYTVDLSKEMAHGFYEGFSNQTLWSLFHGFPSLMKFEPEYWEAYKEANRRFCDVVLAHWRPNDTVWIHDYHLMLLPRMLREAAPGARIGFFLHIPFPPWSCFQLMPHREEVLQGLLGADYLAFHTEDYLQHFRSSAHRVLNIRSETHEIEFAGHTSRIGALPIGINPEEFTNLLGGDETTKQHLARLRERYQNRRILLSVDRLDYTKGIPERLRTFRRLLFQHPNLRGELVLIQVAVPSREGIPVYQDLRREVDALVGQINDEFGAPDRTPVVYTRCTVPRSELVALYTVADVALVTPLRDGLNLVAKEYVACRMGRDGVLVLSEFAGAAAEMREAFLVNPYDEERTAETIVRALACDEEQQHERMRRLYQRVTANNIFEWATRFLSEVRLASSNNDSQRLEEKTRPLSIVSEVSRAEFMV